MSPQVFINAARPKIDNHAGVRAQLDGLPKEVVKERRALLDVEGRYKALQE